MNVCMLYMCFLFLFLAVSLFPSLPHRPPLPCRISCISRLALHLTRSVCQQRFERESHDEKEHEDEDGHTEKDEDEDADNAEEDG